MNDEIAAALAAIQADVRALRVTPAVSVSGVTVGELYDVWRLAHLTLAALATEEWRARVLLGHFAGCTAAALAPADLDGYRAARVATVTRRGRPPTIATVNRELVLLQRVLNFAVSRKHIPANPVHGYKLAAENNARDVVVTEDGIETILRRMGNAAARAWAVLAFESGMRRSELFRLCWRQLDWKAGIIEIPGSHTKTRRSRIVEFPERSRHLVGDLPRVLGCPRVFANPRTGEAYGRRWMYKLFVRAVENSEVVGIDGRRPTWHDLRRSYITLMRRRGVQESVVMQFSGHASRDVFDRYNIVVPEELRPAMEKNAEGRARELAALRLNRRPARPAVQKEIDASASYVRPRICEPHEP